MNYICPIQDISTDVLSEQRNVIEFPHTTRLRFTSTNARQNHMDKPMDNKTSFPWSIWTPFFQLIPLTTPNGTSIAWHILHSYATHFPFITMGHPLCTRCPKIASSLDSIKTPHLIHKFFPWTHQSTTPNRILIASSNSIHAHYQRTNRQTETANTEYQ